MCYVFFADCSHIRETLRCPSVAAQRRFMSMLLLAAYGQKSQCWKQLREREPRGCISIVTKLPFGFDLGNNLSKGERYENG